MFCSVIHQQIPHSRSLKLLHVFKKVGNTLNYDVQHVDKCVFVIVATSSLQQMVDELRKGRGYSVDVGQAMTD